MSPTRKTSTERPSNGLLERLTAEDFELIAPFFAHIESSAGDVLYHAGGRVTGVHFPCQSTMLSLLVSLEDGIEIETVLIGREGAVGGVLGTSPAIAFSRVVVKLEGSLVRLPVRKLEEAQRRSPSLQKVFAQYEDCFVGQLLQSSACNAVHTVEQRAANWIIRAGEHSVTDKVLLTQEQLAKLLGVGRSYTSRIMQVFNAEGILVNRRGTIHIRDRAALQRKSCRCNNAVRKHFERTLPGVYPRLSN